VIVVGSIFPAVAFNMSDLLVGPSGKSYHIDSRAQDFNQHARIVPVASPGNQFTTMVPAMFG
jgi:hypothetical protein